MALLPGHRYLEPHETIPEGALLDVPGGPIPTVCAGSRVVAKSFYMVPVPPARKVRKYMPQATSIEAHDSQKTKAPADASKILAAVGNGATCDEIEIALGMSHQTASARMRDLSRAKLILDSGAKRKTRTGRNAIVRVLGK